MNCRVEVRVRGFAPEPFDSLDEAWLHFAACAQRHSIVQLVDVAGGVQTTVKEWRAPASEEVVCP